MKFKRLNRTVLNSEWWDRAIMNSIKSMAQTASSLLVVGHSFMEVDWVSVLAISFGAGISCIITSIANIKVEDKREIVQNGERKGK